MTQEDGARLDLQRASRLIFGVEDRLLPGDPLRHHLYQVRCELGRCEDCFRAPLVPGKWKAENQEAQP